MSRNMQQLQQGMTVLPAGYRIQEPKLYGTGRSAQNAMPPMSPEAGQSAMGGVQMQMGFAQPGMGAGQMTMGAGRAPISGGQMPLGIAQQGMDGTQMAMGASQRGMVGGQTAAQTLANAAALQQALNRQALTQAGVSNFAQQMQQLGQQLQYLMERLYYAQNQVQTQAQAQLRELQQLQQAVAVTVQQLQQVQTSSTNIQPTIMQ